jgi:hypothetical protein
MTEGHRREPPVPALYGPSADEKSFGRAVRIESVLHIQNGGSS